MPAQAGQGMILGEEQTTAHPPCINSKEIIYKMLLSYMWYNSYTIFQKRSLESIDLNCSLCPARIKRTV